jgi:hypothetical protein
MPIHDSTIKRSDADELRSDADPPLPLAQSVEGEWREMADRIDALAHSTAEMKEALEAEFRQLRQHIDDGLAELSEGRRPQEPESKFVDAPASGDWERAILGANLADNPDLAFQCRKLVSGVLQGDAGSGSLAGQLLLFQSAAPEKMPGLLKEIGEAYYRWHPKTTPVSNKFEEALVAWLQRKCEEQGISNTIELVHPGERFDASRHTASGRGVEIIGVNGWIVLRDNGKVYTKANVAVK